MSISTDSPTFPAHLRRISERTLASIKEIPSPTVQQTFLHSPSPTTPSYRETFLYSPTASETSLRMDSPILAPSNQDSSTSLPTSTAGAYPTPRFYSPTIASHCYPSSFYSNFSTDEKVVDGMSLRPANRMSDILPDDMDLYTEYDDQRPHTRRWSVAVPDGQQEIVIEELDLDSSRSGTTYYTTSSSGAILPDDEYKVLQERQQRAHLEAHFAQPALAPSHTSVRPKTSYQEANLPQDRRAHISEIKNATRDALGSSFDFTDDSYDRGQSSSGTRRATTQYSYEEPIPQRYIDEFNKKWHEDDLKYEHQYRADCTHNAGWRTHQNMYVDIKPLPRHESAPRYANVYEPRPLTREAPKMLRSKFSFDSAVETTLETKPKHSFWRR
ncbi:hypothetical protein BDW02DRAFT_492598 [Decorospora gaudefroyi]|uniref:Uncharacterized protein n=1 Tax=Decorospora gaudefroyi TaxID=184978 RepID=A0A6A5KMR2_9PLEO|nr:hypothetical protein BDW02DRAFT_492598 [Decorospora gaudefroyi]